MPKISVKQIKSPIGRNSSQRKILISLGLNKINRVKIHNDNPSILGMIDKIKHLLKVEKVN
ncbi:MAG: 50S ribosomal protein L30 [Rickettsiales bacterium]|nr:50S ribosomal protein L30 [Rickettsiales bacterium]|tara:strand:+ start:680 stop:862 length:183 start_codon:yes stop_codon:yes gene_type:complete